MSSSKDTKLIGAIDQGTSSTRFLIFSAETGEVITFHQIEVPRILPREGWVEQDPIEIYESAVKCIQAATDKLTNLGFKLQNIACIGITNQRESSILWNKVTGKCFVRGNSSWSDCLLFSIVFRQTFVQFHCMARQPNR